MTHYTLVDAGLVAIGDDVSNDIWTNANRHVLQFAFMRCMMLPHLLPVVLQKVQPYLFWKPHRDLVSDLWAP